MNISKRTILINLSVALFLAFALLTGCTATKEAKMAEETADTAGTPSADTVRMPTEKVNAFWDNKEWTELTKAEQDIWTFVGYNEDVWNGDAKNPPEEDLYWQQLDPAKRKALEKMGYTKSFWNDGDPE